MQLVGFAVLALTVCAVSASYSFLSVGDWGGAAIGETEKNNVYAVSSAMATSATSLDAKFIIGTGDSKLHIVLLLTYFF